MEVVFKSGTQANYDALTSKDDGTLYFTTDTHKIYKGGVEYTSSTSSSTSVMDFDCGASLWTGDAAPYKLAIVNNFFKENNTIIVRLAPQATLAQAEAWGNGYIATAEQVTGKITLKAYGIKPTIDIPIEILYS